MAAPTCLGVGALGRLRVAYTSKGEHEWALRQLVCHKPQAMGRPSRERNLHKGPGSRWGHFGGRYWATASVSDPRTFGNLRWSAEPLDRDLIPSNSDVAVRSLCFD